MRLAQRESLVKQSTMDKGNKAQGLSLPDIYTPQSTIHV